MEGNFVIKYHDQENRHFSICYESVRMDVHKAWDLEKDRFMAAYNLYLGLKKCAHPMQAAGLLSAADDEVKAYIPVIAEAHGGKVFNYSLFLFDLAKQVKEDVWASLVFDLPVTKIFCEKESLRGEILESKFVDLIPLYGSDQIYMLEDRLSSAFPYLTAEQNNRLIRIAREKVDPKPQQPAPYSREYNRELLRRQGEEFLDWFRAGNRKE